MFTQAALLALTALAPLVNAHGSFSGIVIDGTRYEGPIPNNGGGQQFVIREVNTVDPVKGSDNPALSCGSGAGPAALVADARPGSTVGFEWRNGENGPWVHNTGPVLTYMASCGEGSCTTFDSAQAQWFKIDEKGRKDDGSWFMSNYNNDLFAQLTVTLPTNLPAGEYLVRHELIGLHNAMSQGGAEFYPGCAQIRLSAPTRGDAKLPSGNEVVTFPGGYSDTDSGILVPDVYNPGSTYTFPGPQVINNSEEGGVAGGDSGSDGNTDPTGSDAAVPGTPTSSEGAAAPSESAGSGSGSGCGGGQRKVKRVYKRMIRHEVRKAPTNNKAKRSSSGKAQQAVNVVKREVYQPRSNSRVMRGLNPH